MGDLVSQCLAIPVSLKVFRTDLSVGSTSREIFKALWLTRWRLILSTRMHGSPAVFPAHTGVYPEADPRF